MFLPIEDQMPWKTDVEPVKCTPPSCGLAITGSPTAAPEPGTKLITPGGRPASRRSSIRYQLESTEVEAGFQTTVLPSSAGAVGRLPAIEVKLKGVMAKTKPSSGRCSSRFQAPGLESGCSA